MTAIQAVRHIDHQLARTPSVLKPLIKEQVQLGDLAAKQAGWPYYVKAGGLLEEARNGVRAEGEQTFTEYCEEVTGKSYRSCSDWIAAYNKDAQQIERARKAGKTRSAPPVHLRGGLGKSTKGQYRPFREWTEEVDDAAEVARRQQEKEAETRAAEQKLKQQLARKLIEIGYKVLAKELHPDKGGSKDAMSRLSEVRNRLMQVYG
jgi:hypothetical protein